MVIKELSSEQQEHAGDDAVTHSTPHLVRASLQHSRSRAVRLFEHITHFNSLTLFWLASGGYSSREKIGGGSSSKGVQ